MCREWGFRLSTCGVRVCARMYACTLATTKRLLLRYYRVVRKRLLPAVRGAWTAFLNATQGSNTQGREEGGGKEGGQIHASTRAPKGALNKRIVGFTQHVLRRFHLHLPNGPFTILEPQDQEIGELYIVQERCATYFEVPKLGNGRSGSLTISGTAVEFLFLFFSSWKPS